MSKELRSTSESQGNSDVHIRFQLKIPNQGKSASDRHARPWSRLEAVVEPFDPKRGNGWPPMSLSTTLRIHFAGSRWTLTGAVRAILIAVVTRIICIM